MGHELELVEGITPKRARSLNDAGIRTLEDLRSRSLAEIRLVPGLSRLTRAQFEAWQGQARERLAAADGAPAAAVSEPAATSAEPNDGQQYEVFSVTVAINDDGSIRDTRMQHLRSRRARRWAGWMPESMLEFITGATATAPPHPAAEPGPGKPPAPVPPAEVLTAAAPEAPAEAGPVADGDAAAGPAAAPKPPSPTTTVRPALSAALAAERSVVTAGQPFTVTVTLDLTGPAAAADSLRYNAVFEAKPLGAAPKRTLARVQGSLAALGTPDITVEAAGLPAGTYRLIAAVSLRESGVARPSGLAALAEGRILHVLAA